MNIGHHRRKWKSSILGVAQIVLLDIFLASFFVAYVEPKLFFRFCMEKFLSAAPTIIGNMVFLAQEVKRENISNAVGVEVNLICTKIINRRRGHLRTLATNISRLLW